MDGKIINIRGTSGSGKSTLVRRIRAHYKGPMHPHYEEGRTRPIATVHEHLDSNQRSLVLIGHYETACGGADTVPNMVRIFELVREWHAAGHDVLFEGLLISSDFNRTLALHSDFQDRLLVVGLDIPLGLCMESINERRHNAWQGRCERMKRRWQERASEAESKGRSKPRRPSLPSPPKPASEKNTKSKWTAVRNSIPKLSTAGVSIVYVGRDQAYHHTCSHLGLQPIDSRGQQ